MLSHTLRLITVLSIVAGSHSAFAATPCKNGLIGITLIEGEYNPPASMSPDTESLKPTGKWPTNLIEQGWHNLRKAARPLNLVCRYANGASETIQLPDTTDSCVLKPGLVVTCQ